MFVLERSNGSGIDKNWPSCDRNEVTCCQSYDLLSRPTFHVLALPDDRETKQKYDLGQFT